MKSNASGFSLVEVLVVCAIVVLLATLSYFCTSFVRRWAVYTECVHLHAVCRYLQQRALSSNTKHYLFLDTVHNTYTYNDTKYALPAHVRFGTVLGLKGPPAHPQRIVATPITFPSSTVIFYPSGVISAGTIYLTDTKKTWCYALSNAVSRIAHLRRYEWSGVWRLCALKEFSSATSIS